MIFAWSVREETGLEGAMALARRYAPSVKRVYSVDTFVSSDSPVETTRFAYAPLGRGAVIRGLDNSAIAPPAEMDRILNIARAQRDTDPGGRDEWRHGWIRFRAIRRVAREFVVARALQSFAGRSARSPRSAGAREDSFTRSRSRHEIY